MHKDGAHWCKLVRKPGMPKTLQLHNFCLFGETFLDIFLGIRSTTKAHFISMKHFKFYGCAPDFSYLFKIILCNFDMTARNMCSFDSNLNKPNRILEVVRSSLKKHTPCSFEEGMCYEHHEGKELFIRYHITICARCHNNLKMLICAFRRSICFVL